MEIILIIVFLGIYLYVNTELIRNKKFIENKINTKSFVKSIKDYSGYVVCVERNFLQEEVKLFRSICKLISKTENCFLLDLSNKYNQLDMNTINYLGITSVPSIIKIDRNGHKEIISFKSIPDHFTNKQLINEIKLKLIRNG
jgi:hypothetical protein